MRSLPESPKTFYAGRMMKQTGILIVCLTVAISGASSATGATVKKYKNCTALHAVYPSGVAKPGALDKQGKAKGTPKTDAKLYAANAHLDRDKDGWACEV